MQSSGACSTEVHEILGHIPGQFPQMLGHEPVGWIVAAAPDATTRKICDQRGRRMDSIHVRGREWCRPGRRMCCPDLKGRGSMYRPVTLRPPDVLELKRTDQAACSSGF